MKPRLGLQTLGIVTPLGSGKADVAQALVADSRKGLATRSDLVLEREVHVGAVTAPLPDIPADLAAFDCRNNRLMLAALQEIAEEIESVAQRFGRCRIAIILGTSTSGLAESEAAHAEFRQTGKWPAAYKYCQHEAGGLAEFAARWLQVSGPAYTIVTACSSSAKTFASARRLIAMGVCDAAVVGGADSLCRLTLNGFASLEALSPGLCNPFSANRDGINIGEGAAAFLLTRDSAPIELLGVGETSDAYHISAPNPEGKGASDAMRLALADAGIEPKDVSYINLHGTATPLNDAMESRAMASVFPDRTPCSSTKSMTGHMLGAAGGCEAAFLWLTLHPEFSAGLLPPHLWDGQADPDLPQLRFVAPGEGLEADERTAMLSSSFAFGGSNIALVFGRGWT